MHITGEDSSLANINNNKVMHVIKYYMIKTNKINRTLR